MGRLEWDPSPVTPPRIGDEKDQEPSTGSTRLISSLTNPQT